MGDGLRKIKSGEQACAGDLANYDNSLGIILDSTWKLSLASVALGEARCVRPS